MLNAFGIYLLTGALLLGLTALFVRLTRKDEEVSELVKIARQMSPPKTRREQLLEWAMYPFIWLLWPVGMLVAIQAMLKQHGIAWNPFFWENTRTSKDTGQEVSKFVCHPEDLIEPVVPEQVEKASYVHDPLGRVPNQPFGHLHKGWSQLLSQLEPGDTLWRFHAPKRTWKPASSGFAVVRASVVIAEFMDERQ
jgi:hypothetical protein